MKQQTQVPQRTKCRRNTEQSAGAFLAEKGEASWWRHNTMQTKKELHTADIAWDQRGGPVKPKVRRELQIFSVFPYVD